MKKWLKRLGVVALVALAFVLFSLLIAVIVTYNLGMIALYVGSMITIIAFVSYAIIDYYDL